MRSKEEMEKFNASNFQFNSIGEEIEWEKSDDPLPKRYVEEMINETSELDTSVDEWKAVMEVPDDPGYTLHYLASQLGIPETTLRRKIQKLIIEGKAKIGKATFAGRRCAVYQLTGEEK